jgi:cytochrome P450
MSLSPPMPPMASDRIGGLQLLFAMRRNALSAFPERCINEPVVRLRAAGRPLVVVTAPDAVGHMMITHSEDYVRLPFGRRVLGPITGRGLLTSEGETWRQQRRAMSPAFTPRNVPIMSAHIMRCTEVTCDRLARTTGQPINLLEEMQTLSLEIAATSLFSMEAATFGDQVRTLVSEYMGTVGRLYLTDVFLPDSIPTPLRRRRADFRRRWTSLIASIIQARRQSGASDAPRDLFDLLSDAHGEDRQDLLVDEVATMIVAGHETTALALFWMCSLLARSPEWQARLVEEARSHDLSASAAGKTLPKLEIARAIVQETLRMYSPGFMAGRLAKQTHELCGVTVPKGSMVLVPFWLIHRIPQWWPNPTSFDPSRFLNGAEPTRHTYLPFGVGRHVCIGAQLAMSEAVLAIARIAQQFKVRMVDDRPILPVATLTTRPDYAARFVLQTH